MSEEKQEQRHPTAEQVFGDEQAEVEEFNRLPVEAQDQLESALAFVVRASDRAAAIACLDDVVDAFKGAPIAHPAIVQRLTVLRLRLADQARPSAAQARPESPALAAAPAAEPREQATRGVEIPEADQRIIAETVEACRKAPSEAEQAKYLRDVAASCEADHPAAAQALALMATTLESGSAKAVEREFAALGPEDRQIVTDTMASLESAPSDEEAMKYLASVAAECEHDHPAAAQCLRSFSATISAARSAATARAAA